MKYQIPPDVHAAWNRGDEIAAIRALREATGLGLKEAKEILDSGGETVTISPAQPAATLPNEVYAAMARGDKIEAIKLARGATGLGLKEAKALIDAAAPGASAAVRGSAHHLAPGEVPRGRINWLAIATMFGLVLAALLLVSKMLGP
jgi:ribosomal protein L7/L12